jgi:glycerophosphoryl diester phosphodiesterase
MGLVVTMIAAVLALYQTGAVHDLHQDVIRNTVGFAPHQFYKALDLSENAHASTSLLTIAHNAGDRESTAQSAIGYGADVVEVDVVEVDGRLYAAHDIPNPHISSVTFRGPTLASIWSVAADHARIELDLKGYSAGFLTLLVSFLDAHGGGDGVIISSRSPGAIATLRSELPDATLVYSVGDRASLASLQSSEALVDEIDGVSIRASLLDEEAMDWLQDHDLLVYAWTVNDFSSAEWLVELGVDGFATDNLALIEHFNEPPEPAS